MPEIEEEIIGSHTEDDQLQEETDTDDIYAAFGIEKPLDKDEEEAPAIEQKPEPRTIKVKHNKEEIEVDVSDDKLPEYVQRSLALDKERERKAELERSLDRAAKLAGYQNHSDFIANLDKIEQHQQQAKQDQFTQLQNQLINEYEDAGGDPRNLAAWLENNPLLQEAKEVLVRERMRAEHDKQSEMQQQVTTKWSELYEAYPHLLADAKAWERDETPTFFTTEMQSRIDRGYDPKDAFELAHRSTLQTQTKKQTEQRLIKEQQLGLRSQVETIPSPDREPSVPRELEDAFEAFGLGRSAAKKYVK